MPVYREPQVIRRQYGLGFRPSGYTPTSVDYAVYRRQRDDFLNSARGRAALFAGGIIGRLARYVVDDNYACSGPSDEVFETGLRLWDGESHTAYWDDTLTLQEIDLICGAYRVQTEEDGEQKKSISWWPKPNAFNSSGLNIGWWSPDCERWFQKRLADIEKDQATLHTASEWKRVIRFKQKSREVSLANDKISAIFLSLPQ
ncbi:hypothetical protein B0H10DRAFT_1822927 [Mycena sp. CBHHK59/15]|nr:hypothetical protein B0H10DRAFT_1856061 [Mycena sp. CBHHK59/15]KAJ6602947.1 hypothetical protein B0H10DRAFT_1822927 [Mycena sp. CBHHK59/15]